MKKSAPLALSVDVPSTSSVASRPTAPRRAALVEVGRFVAVALPVFMATAVNGSFVVNGSFHVRALVLAGCLSTIWFLAINSSFTSNAKELLALGVVPAAARGTFVGLIAVSAVDFWIAHVGISRPWLAATAVLILVLFTSWESFSRRSLLPRRRIIIVGGGRSALDLIRELNETPSLQFDVVGVVDDNSSGTRKPGAPILGEISHLPNILAEHLPELVILAVDRDRPKTFGYLLDSASTGFRVLELPQFYEHALGRVPVRDLPRAWFMSVLHLYQRPHSRAAKRLFDVVVAATGLLLMAPSLLMTALFVRRTPGPVILRQTRIGEHGQPFTIYKFRTMRDDAEALDGAVWAAQHDPRVTRVGGLLRRMRLDEIPQLWNVLRGEMSIVGPRPERPEFLVQLQEEVPYWTRRHLIKPGVTGWAQIRRGYTADVDGSSDKLSFDLWYLRHRSLLVDLAICIQTIRTMLGGAPSVPTHGQHNPRLSPVPPAVDLTD